MSLYWLSLRFNVYFAVDASTVGGRLFTFHLWISWAMDPQSGWVSSSLHNDTIIRATLSKKCMETFIYSFKRSCYFAVCSPPFVVLVTSSSWEHMQRMTLLHLNGRHGIPDEGVSKHSERFQGWSYIMSCCTHVHSLCWLHRSSAVSRRHSSNWERKAPDSCSILSSQEDTKLFTYSVSVAVVHAAKGDRQWLRHARVHWLICMDCETAFPRLCPP